MSIRAVRNSNPGNIEAATQWQGLMPRAQMTLAQANEHRFAVFSSPKWGFRALATILRNYEKLHGLRTAREIITRWAPPVENDTEAYIAHVCSKIGHGADEPLNLSDAGTLSKLCRAIAEHECGGWFFAEHDLNEGVRLAIGGPAPLIS